MKRKCLTEGCANVPKARRRVCDTCRDRAFRKRHPIAYLFNRVKQHARYRGKSFEITLEQFEEFCRRTDYHLKSGREAGDLSIDRIHSTLGYQPGNLRAITVSENSSKRDREARRDEAMSAIPMKPARTEF